MWCQVNVAQAAAPSAATKGMIEKIEDKKAAGEKHMFEQVGGFITSLNMFEWQLR